MGRLSFFFLWVFAPEAWGQGFAVLYDPPPIRTSLEQTEYPGAPRVDAAYLFDLNTTEFEQSETGFGIRYNRRIRIKVYRAGGTEYGTVSIPYYRNGLTMQVKNIRGATYNLDAEGKVQYEPVTEANLTDKKIYDRYHEMVIVFPQVKVGSVLELSYDIVSTRPSLLPDFNVQSDIPKAYTRYYARIPAFYNYNLVRIGNINYSRYDMSLSGVMEQFGSSYQFQRILVDIEAKNVPPFVKEPFMPAEVNTRGKLDFQFTNLNLPDRDEGDGFSTWEGFTKWLLKTDSWQGYYKKTRIVKSRMPASLLQGAGLANAIDIYEWVQGQVSWDGYRAMEPDLEAKTNDGSRPGNIADVNLTLYGALEAAGYEVYPLLGSTRSHGRINPEAPVLTQYNNVLVMLVLDGSSYFLNAAVPGLPFAALLNNDQNGAMLRVHPKEPELVDITAGHSARWRYEGEVLWDQSQEAYTSEWTVSQSGIAKGLSWDEELVTKNWDLEEVAWNNRTEGVVPEKATLTTFSGKYPIETAGEQLLIPVMVDQRRMSSPFSSGSRIHPMDFGYPQQHDYKVVIQIPSGYALEEVPATINAVMPNGKGMCFFQATETEGKITIQSSFRLKGAVYGVKEYPEVQKLFNQMAEAYTQTLVLVKEKG